MTTGTYDAIDCQGFAGGFTCGTVRAGFRLVGKREHAGGFGVNACEANRHILGEQWQAEACSGEEWTAYDVPYVFGNPPCSGFSLLSRKDFRGPDSPVNSCMWDFVSFASRCNAQIMVFESVAQAFKQGQGLMQNLRADVEQRTGQQWTLTHVLHNAYSLGGAAIRRRYFFVCHRIPFGVEPVELKRVPSLNDVIGDLEGLGDTWEPQPYKRPPTWWSKKKRSASGLVDGHASRHTPARQRAFELLEPEEMEWGVKEPIAKVMTRYFELTGDLPPSWRHLKSYEKLMSQAPDFQMGYNQLVRWNGERAARVITGGGLDLVMHPNEERLITHREAVRIQGFPDDWKVRPLIHAGGAQMLWGKGIPVDCGEWVSTWVRRSLDGEPGSSTGELIGDREFLIDHTNDYRAVSDER